jgi:heat shock protein HslJ/uncharacterized lipoprotein YbaY/membrane-bound inhibitor of C-type lysozyme
MVQRTSRTGCIAATLLALAGCSDGTPPAPVPAELPEVGQAERIRIEGSLYYMQRIALPDNAQVLVELREGARGPLAVEQRIELRGRQVPVEFAIELDRRLLKPATDYVLQAAIEVDGLPRWLAGPVAVDLAGALVQLGEIRLDSHTPEPFASEFDCGDLRITVSALGEDLQVRVGEELFRMRPVVSASGAKYALPDDPSTAFWSKGDTALLEIRGQAWPECVPVRPAAAASAAGQELRAMGQEPPWSLRIGTEETELVTRYGEERVSWPTPQPEVQPEKRRWAIPGATTPVVITAREQVCVDTMSGMPFPLTVSVDTGDGHLEGCGGRPVELLLGAEWRVASIDGQPLVEGSTVTLAFTDEGRVAGSGSCNRYSASFTLTGESLTIGQAAATKMACAPGLMEQEQRFFHQLAGISGFAIAADGALQLTVAGQPVLAARRGG